jgi:hypothetical protein
MFDFSLQLLFEAFFATVDNYLATRQLTLEMRADCI